MCRRVNNRKGKKIASIGENGEILGSGSDLGNHEIFLIFR